MPKEQDKSYSSGGEQAAGYQQMTTPAEAFSSGTGQQQTAFDRERVGEPERQDPGVAKTSPGEQAGSADAAQPVFAEQAALKRQLAEAQAKLDRQRQQTNERNRRWRKNNPERVRELNKIHKRTYRARKREQGS